MTEGTVIVVVVLPVLHFIDLSDVYTQSSSVTPCLDASDATVNRAHLYVFHQPLALEMLVPDGFFFYKSDPIFYR